MKLGSMTLALLGLVSAMAVTSNEARAETAPVILIGTVDMQKALRTVEAGKKAKQQLETIFNKKKQELQTEEQNLKKMHDEFQKQSMVLSEQARVKKQTELQQKLAAFQETTMRSQQELQKKEQELTAPIVNKIRTIIQDMAKKKNYSVVLEKNENSVLFSLEKDDLTEDVVKEYNKGEKS